MLSPPEKNNKLRRFKDLGEGEPIIVEKGEPFEGSTYKIGRAVITFSTLESMVEWGIQQLLGVDGETVCIILADLTFAEKVNQYSRLYRYKVANFNKQDFDKFIGLLDSIRKDRNELLHSLWIVDTERELAIQSKKKGNAIQYKSKQIKQKDLDDLIKKIGYAISQLMGFNYPLERKFGE